MSDIRDTLQQLPRFELDETSRMVREFHEMTESWDHLRDRPGMPEDRVKLTRVQLLIEEVSEVAHALGKEDLLNLLQELADVQYVLDGAFLACGLAELKTAAVREIHRANMAKKGPDGTALRDKSGRILKPVGWTPPDMRKVLTEYYISKAGEQMKRDGEI